MLLLLVAGLAAFVCCDPRGGHTRTYARCKEPIALADWAAGDLLTRKGSALLAKSLRAEHKGLPRLVWQTFGTMDLPPATSALRASMQVANPRWKFYLVDDRAAHTFIAQHFHPHVLAAYTSIVPGVARADFWRYAVLYLRGGVYLDLDSNLTVPLCEWANDTVL